MLLLFQVTINDVQRRLGGLFSHRQRNQPEQPSQLVSKDIDMPSVQRRVVIVGQRRVRRWTQAHQVIIGNTGVMFRLRSPIRDGALISSP